MGSEAIHLVYFGLPFDYFVLGEVVGSVTEPLMLGKFKYDIHFPLSAQIVLH